MKCTWEERPSRPRRVRPQPKAGRGRFRCLWAGAQSAAAVITEARLSWTRPTRVCVQPTCPARLAGSCDRPVSPNSAAGVWDPSQCPAQVPEAVPAQSSITASPRDLKSQQAAPPFPREDTRPRSQRQVLCCLVQSFLCWVRPPDARPWRVAPGGPALATSTHSESHVLPCGPWSRPRPQTGPNMGRGRGARMAVPSEGHWVQGGIVPVSPVAALAVTATPRPGPARSSHLSVTSTESSFLSSSCSSVSVSVVSEMDDTCHTQSLSLSSCG